MPPAGEAVDVGALAAGLRRPSTVEIVGEVADIAPYVDAADVVLVPSDRAEGFGLVAIEAFARGRPVVASDAGGMADVVDHGRTGWLYPPGDSEALARILADLTRPAVVAAGRTARREYEERYTPARFARDWRNAVGLPR